MSILRARQKIYQTIRQCKKSSFNSCISDGKFTFLLQCIQGVLSHEQQEENQRNSISRTLCNLKRHKISIQIKFIFHHSKIQYFTAFKQTTIKLATQTAVFIKIIICHKVSGSFHVDPSLQKTLSMPSNLHFIYLICARALLSILASFRINSRNLFKLHRNSFTFYQPTYFSLDLFR